MANSSARCRRLSQSNGPVCVSSSRNGQRAAVPLGCRTSRSVWSAASLLLSLPTISECRCGRPIPRGLCPPAQGCDPALSDNPSPLIQPKCLQCATAVLIPLPRKSGGATLGIRANHVSTPTGLWSRSPPTDTTPLGLARPEAMTQGSSFLATLGFVAESLWDSRNSSSKMWVMISSLLELSGTQRARKREQAPRTPYASRHSLRHCRAGKYPGRLATGAETSFLICGGGRRIGPVGL